MRYCRQDIATTKLSQCSACFQTLFFFNLFISQSNDSDIFASIHAAHNIHNMFNSLFLLQVGFHPLGGDLVIANPRALGRWDDILDVAADGGAPGTAPEAGLWPPKTYKNNKSV